MKHNLTRIGISHAPHFQPLCEYRVFSRNLRRQQRVETRGMDHDFASLLNKRRCFLNT